MINTREIAAEYRMSSWAQIMKERKESGLSIKAFCKQREIAENTYFYWQHKLREAACRQMVPGTQERLETIASPKELVVRSASCSPTPPGWVTCTDAKVNQKDNNIFIEIGNSRISVSANVDLEFLAKVCRLLTAL